MIKNSYFSRIKNPKFILALSIMLLAIIAIYTDCIKNYTNSFFKKTNAPVINDTDNNAPEILSVVVTSEPSSANEIDVSTDSDDENTVEKGAEEETIQPNIVKHTPISSNLKNLVVAHNLISKFLQNIDYISELNELEKLDLPKNIVALLEEMKGYNSEYLMNTKSTKTKVIFPDKGLITKMIGRFIKIEKTPTNLIEQKNMYDRVLKNIHVIEEYFYSRNLLDKGSDND